MRLTSTPGFAAVAVMLALAACGKPTPPPAPVAPPAPPPPPAAPEFTDLVGARGASGEMALTDRGFTAAKKKGLTAFWYHAPSNTCVRVVTSKGRYKTVVQTDPKNCGH